MKNSSTVAFEAYIDANLELLRDKFHHQLESFDHYKERVKHQSLENLKEFQGRFKSGYKIALEELAKRKIPVDPYRIESKTNFTEKETFGDKIRNGKLCYEILEYTPDMMTEVYDIAVTLYEENRLNDAANVCYFLVTLHPFISEFWECLGVAYQKDNFLDEALFAHQIAFRIDQTSWETLARILDCSLLKGHGHEAIAFLDSVLEQPSCTEEIKEKGQAAKVRIQNYLKKPQAR